LYCEISSIFILSSSFLYKKDITTFGLFLFQDNLNHNLWSLLVSSTMPKQHKGDTLISDLKLKLVTDITLVTRTNGTRRSLGVAYGQRKKCVTIDSLSVTLPD